MEALFRACDLAQPLHISGLLHELERSELSFDPLINSAGVTICGALSPRAGAPSSICSPPQLSPDSAVHSTR
ncbi:hypothetical protein PH586_15115 [Pseudomonas sp. SA3-5]|uniref:Uncharacterized protein n=1 Tax=Pseudomonas aestuarii TaxID=3018340 RepID=A0ABT4XHP0_9PSED|nr:hypothetical protein [Pseudomonas aestuarii]MDA7087719.1 hypothetical protein [Pseudomonas aestuarii]